MKEGLHYRQVVITTSKNKSGVPCLVLVYSRLIWLSRKTCPTFQQHLEVDEGSSSKISLHQFLPSLGGRHHQRCSPLLVRDVKAASALPGESGSNGDEDDGDDHLRRADTVS